MNRFAFTIIQLILLVDISKQSKAKQGINILKTIGSTIKKPISKTIGNTIKNSMGMLSQKINKSGLKSVFNMVSKSKPQLPFLFATGGFIKLNEMSLVSENDFVTKKALTNGEPIKTNLKFFDIATDLTNNQFKGMYTGKGGEDYTYGEHQVHEADLEHVIRRANEFGVKKFLLTTGHFAAQERAAAFCEGRSDCWTTVGVNPSRASDITKHEEGEQAYYDKMEAMIQRLGTKCSAIGECGLDYFRQEWSDKESQLKHFPKHFDFAEKYKLPMYFHSRNSQGDFLRIVKENRHRFSDGVVHSFTGNEEELNGILDLNLYVGINGRSLKTQESVDLVKKIPLDRIMLETDSPYSEIRNSHASMKYVKTKINGINNKKNWSSRLMVKGRNEPCKIVQACEIVAALKGVSEEEVANTVYENSCRVFARE